VDFEKLKEKKMRRTGGGGGGERHLHGEQCGL
jgi:hypothetical protein